MCSAGCAGSTYTLILPFANDKYAYLCNAYSVGSLIALIKKGGLKAVEKNNLDMAGTATLLFSQVLNVCEAVELQGESELRKFQL